MHKIKKYRRKGLIQGINCYLDDHMDNSPKKKVLPMLRKVDQTNITSFKSPDMSVVNSSPLRAKDYVQDKLKSKFGLFKEDRNNKFMQEIKKITLRKKPKIIMNTGIRRVSRSVVDQIPTERKSVHLHNLSVSSIIEPRKEQSRYRNLKKVTNKR